VTTYEILLLLDPEQAEARQDEIIARTRELVEKNGGTWRSHDAWGRRRLAYPIAHKEEGVYHLVVFDVEAATLAEISRVLKIEDAVLRHMATRHIEGSRTTAPRDDAAAVPAAPATAVSETAEPEYAAAEEQPGEAGGAAGEEGDARPENRGEEE
jgi:small subunit ribosomal protein S6